VEELILVNPLLAGFLGKKAACSLAAAGAVLEQGHERRLASS
jgi:hypothetical protein